MGHGSFIHRSWFGHGFGKRLPGLAALALKGSPRALMGLAALVPVHFGVSFSTVPVGFCPPVLVQ